MAVLTDEVNGVLGNLRALYGTGEPTPRASAALRETQADDLGRMRGRGTVGYGDHLLAQRNILQAQYGREGIVVKTVAESGNGTLHGRSALDNHIADMRNRLQALAAVGDTRFGGAALLDSAHQTIANATRQVNSDIDASRKQAAQIMPPVTVPARGRVPEKIPTRRRSRRRQRVAREFRSRTRENRSTGTRKGVGAVKAAEACQGLPYVWGGGGAGGPSGGGFDCSGLTQYAIAQATDGEVVLPRTTYEQIYAGERISARDAQPGDLVFPRDSFSSRGPEHVQLAAGNGMVIEAPYSGATVTYSRMPPDAVVVRVV